MRLTPRPAATSVDELLAGATGREAFHANDGLCLLGALVQFGWEKALGDDAELTWWIDAADPGARWL